MSGCNTDGSPKEQQGFGLPTFNNSHCGNWMPDSGKGVKVTSWHYPARNTDLHWPGVERDRIMYGSVIMSIGGPTTGGNQASLPLSTCGKEKRLEGSQSSGFGRSSSNTQTTTMYRVWNTVPAKLSFFPIDSDQWFAYLYDTSTYFVADSACTKHLTYKIRTTSQGTGTGTGTGTGGGGLGGGGQQQVAFSTRTECVHCGGSVTPTSTSISYTTPDGDLTGIPERPFPTIYTASSAVKRIAFKYNNATTQLTNSVTSLSLQVGSTTTPAWAENAGVNTSTSTVNNWRQNEYDVDVFKEFGSPSFANKGLIITVRFTPIILSQVNGVYTFGGTTISIVGVSSGGSGYAVNNSFNLSYTHTHTNNTTSVINFTVVITAVGSVSVSSGTGATKISKGESLNGWTVAKVMHTDIKNFPWHVLELSGNGSNFTKDTNYTTSGGKSINVCAGKGIPDRAMIVGMYEFRQKEIQFEILNLKKDVPHAFDDIKQPEVTVTVTNGVVTGATIVSGGSGFDKLPYPATIVIGIPPTTTGKQAEVEGKFTNGVLTSVKIINGGSGYSTSAPPGIKVPYMFKNRTDTVFEGLDPNTVSAFKDKVASYQGELGKFTGVKKTPKPSQNTSFPDVEQFGPENKTYNKMPDHFLLKFSRSKTYTDPKSGQTVKKTSDEWGEKVFVTIEDAKLKADELKSEGYEVSIEKKVGVSFTTYAKEAEKEYEKYAKETTSAGKNAGLTAPATTEEEYKAILGAGSQPVQNITPLSIVEDFDYDSKTKVTYTLAQDKFDKADIDKLPIQPPVKSDQYYTNLDKTLGKVAAPTQTGKVNKDLYSDEPTSVIKKETSTEISTITKAGTQLSYTKQFGADYDTKDKNFDQMIDDITYKPDQHKYTNPYDLPKVITVKASFSKLPCASRYRKYFIIQYVPDKRENSYITVNLAVTSANTNNCNNVCSPCPIIPNPPSFGAGTNQTQGTGANATTFNTAETLIGCSIQALGPTTFSVSGTIDIYNNLTATTQVFASAVSAWGNPFESECP